MKKTYSEMKEQAREMAVFYQFHYAEQQLSYAELELIGNFLHKLGKRYGLLREFKENGIPC